MSQSPLHFEARCPCYRINDHSGLRRCSCPCHLPLEPFSDIRPRRRSRTLSTHLQPDETVVNEENLRNRITRINEALDFSVERLRRYRLSLDERYRQLQGRERRLYDREQLRNRAADWYREHYPEAVEQAQRQAVEDTGNGSLEASRSTAGDRILYTEGQPSLPELMLEFTERSRRLNLYAGPGTQQMMQLTGSQLVNESPHPQSPPLPRVNLARELRPAVGLDQYVEPLCPHGGKESECLFHPD